LKCVSTGHDTRPANHPTRTRRQPASQLAAVGCLDHDHHQLCHPPEHLFEMAGSVPARRRRVLTPPPKRHPVSPGFC
jgi:hypothetical protein